VNKKNLLRRYVIKFGEKRGKSCNFLLKFGPPTKKSGHPCCIANKEWNKAIKPTGENYVDG